MKHTIGLDSLYFATITKDDATGVTYGEMTAMPEIQSAEITVETASGDLYADDMLIEHNENITAYNIAIDMAGIDESIRAQIAGHDYDVLTKTTTEKATDIAPSIAIAFRSLNSDGTYKFVKLANGKFAEAGDSYKTKGENTEYQTKKMTGKFMPRKFDQVLKIVTDDATKGSTWFTDFGDLPTV